jgi:hypothetical protein
MIKDLKNIILKEWYPEMLLLGITLLWMENKTPSTKIINTKIINFTLMLKNTSKCTFLKKKKIFNKSIALTLKITLKIRTLSTRKKHKTKNCLTTTLLLTKQNPLHSLTMTLNPKSAASLDKIFGMKIKMPKKKKWSLYFAIVNF